MAKGRWFRLAWHALFWGAIAAIVANSAARDKSGLGWRPRSREPKAAHPATEIDAHGRDARSPVQIPSRGWRDIGIRTFNEFFADRVLSLSAGVTFYALLAVFPAISAMISLYGLFLDPKDLQDQINAASWVLPSGAIEVMHDQALRITAQGSSTLGFGFILSLAIALWSANAGTKAMIEALNIAYEEVERRSFIKLTLVTLGFTATAIVFAAFATAAIVALPIMLRLLHLDTGTEWLISLLRWPGLAVVVAMVVTVVYRYGPCRQRARWTWVTLGSAVAAVLWLAVSAGFSWYVSRFGTYNETYGSLGAVVGFMTWMWLSISVVLFGAELNAEIEHQTAVDTTTGAPRPLGTRGAHMADTIGPAQ